MLAKKYEIALQEGGALCSPKQGFSKPVDTIISKLATLMKT
jgi:hypothetical protein